MNFLSTAPARQPIPDRDFPEYPRDSHSEKSSKKMVTSLWLLWDNRRFLLRVFLVAMIASTLIAFLVPARYESTSRLMPPDNQPGSGLAMAAAALSGVASGGLGGIAGDFLGLKSTSDIFVGVLESRTVQDKLIEQFDLKKVYGARTMDDARKALASHTSISLDRKSQIVSITVTDRRPQRAAAMAQAYVDELNRLVSELSTSSARRERIFLEGRLQAVNQDLQAAEKDFSQFASKNTAIDVKEQGKAMVGAAATLQGELIALQSEYEALRQIYTDNNVRVRSVQARIEELKRQLNKLGGSSDDAQGGSSEGMYPSIRKLPILGVTYADLYRRTKIQETVLETLTKEYEMAKVQEVKEIPTVRVLDAADVPDKKAFPPRALMIFLGSFLGTCLGALFVIGSAHWNAIDPETPEKKLVAEVWGEMKAYSHLLRRNGANSAATKHRAMENVDTGPSARPLDE